MQPRDIAEYLEHVADRLAESGGVYREPPEILVDRELRTGKLDAALWFHNGWRLEVTILALGPANFPDWLDYRFHLMDDHLQCVIRFDNSAHHAGTVYFPHHKHVGPTETVVASPRPSLAEIVREVRAVVFPEA
jgi:hypothetical protein